RRAMIRIQFDENIRPLAILGREGEIRGRTVEIPLHQLYNGQERFALIEIERPPRQAGTKESVGHAEVLYEEIATQQSTTVRSPVLAVRYSSDSDEVKTSANLPVQTEVLEVRGAAARDRAIEFADVGKRPEAAAALREVR